MALLNFGKRQEEGTMFLKSGKFIGKTLYFHPNLEEA
jgi:hypothetical protein